MGGPFLLCPATWRFGVEPRDRHYNAHHNGNCDQVLPRIASVRISPRALLVTHALQEPSELHQPLRPWPMPG